MTKVKEQKLPKWFQGEIYDEGSVVVNPFSGSEYELNAVESACEVFDLDISECDYNVEIDYDNRVVVNDFDWSRCQEELTERIMNRLEKVFAVAEDEE